MSFESDMLKGFIEGSGLSTALTEPIALANKAMTLTIQAADAWKAAMDAAEKAAAGYGVQLKGEAPK
jgi:hypothetical protein